MPARLDVAALRGFGASVGRRVRGPAHAFEVLRRPCACGTRVPRPAGTKGFAYLSSQHLTREPERAAKVHRTTLTRHARHRLSRARARALRLTQHTQAHFSSGGSRHWGRRGAVLPQSQRRAPARRWALGPTLAGPERPVCSVWTGARPTTRPTGQSTT